MINFHNVVLYCSESACHTVAALSSGGVPWANAGSATLSAREAEHVHTLLIAENLKHRQLIDMVSVAYRV